MVGKGVTGKVEAGKIGAAGGGTGVALGAGAAAAGIIVTGGGTGVTGGAEPETTVIWSVNLK